VGEGGCGDASRADLGGIIAATAIVMARASDRPELWAETNEISEEVWPQYNLHGAVLGRFWGRLRDEFPDFQFVLYDDELATR
jgi:galactose mutarotase-like enzyme